MDNNAEDVEVESYPDPDFIPGPPPPPQIMPDGSVVQMDAPPPPMLHNATVTRRTIDGRVHINALPPEEFLIDIGLPNPLRMRTLGASEIPDCFGTRSDGVRPGRNGGVCRTVG